MSIQQDSRHPAIDTSRRANELAKKLTHLARIQASALHSSASSVDSIKAAGLSTQASAQTQDGFNEQVLSFCSRVPVLVSSCGLIKPGEPAHASQDVTLGLLRIAEQANKSLLPTQNFAIVERMFDSLLKQHSRAVAEQEESKAIIQKLQSELARSKREDLLRSWQDEAKRNAENNHAKMESMEQEIAFLKNAAREFDAKVSCHPTRVALVLLNSEVFFQEASIVLENNRLLEELRHARRADSRPASSADISALEAKLMLADATIMRWCQLSQPHCLTLLSLVIVRLFYCLQYAR
jgi:hypothetical protein